MELAEPMGIPFHVAPWAGGKGFHSTGRRSESPSGAGRYSCHGGFEKFEVSGDPVGRWCWVMGHNGWLMAEVLSLTA